MENEAKKASKVWLVPTIIAAVLLVALIAFMLILGKGTKAVSDGTQTLAESVAPLKDGTAQLSDGVDQYTKGVDTIHKAMPTLTDGVEQYTEGVDTLNGYMKTLNEAAPTLASGVKQLATGAAALNAGVNGGDGVNNLSAGLSTLNGTISQLTGGLKTLLGTLDENAKTFGKAAGDAAGVDYDVTNTEAAEDAAAANAQGAITDASVALVTYTATADFAGARAVQNFLASSESNAAYASQGAALTQACSVASGAIAMNKDNTSYYVNTDSLAATLGQSLPGGIAAAAAASGNAKIEEGAAAANKAIEDGAAAANKAIEDGAVQLNETYRALKAQGKSDEEITAALGMPAAAFPLTPAVVAQAQGATYPITNEMAAQSKGAAYPVTNEMAAQSQGMTYPLTAEIILNTQKEAVDAETNRVIKELSDCLVASVDDLNKNGLTVGTTTVKAKQNYLTALGNVIPALTKFATFYGSHGAAQALVTVRDGIVGNGITGDNMDKLAAGAASLNDGVNGGDGVNNLSAGLAALAKGTADLDSAVNGKSGLVSSVAQLYKDGTKKLSENSDALRDGVKQLADGAKQLSENSKALRDGAATLKEAAPSLIEGIGKLKDGAKQVNGFTPVH